MRVTVSAFVSGAVFTQLAAKIRIASVHAGCFIAGCTLAVTVTSILRSQYRHGIT
jgi:hypothetical protein